MELTDDAPKFPKLPFLVGDAVLIAVAVYIASAAEAPLPAPAIYTIAACVGLGAVLAALPFIIDYNRRQEALLTDRQNALEALARTAAAAAEQASIAASGLHEIAELAQKNLRLADQLPQKLHERVAEFNRAQDDALAAELESLQQEVNTLRASEAERLESAADKIHRSATELTKLDAGLRQHISSLDEAARRAHETVASAAANAVAAIEQRLGSLSAASPSVSANPVSPVETEKHPRPRSSKPSTPPGATGDHPPSHRPPTPDSPVATVSAPAPTTAASAPPPSTVAVPITPPTPPEATNAAGSRGHAPLPKRRSGASDTPLLGGLLSEEPPADVISEPVTRRGARHHPPAPSPAEATPKTEAPAVPSKAAATSAARASDGMTRLIVTAYIGIGNKLFVRGHGPGLSADRGVPLQFVSIGKWRWETPDAQQPVALKLYKNDQVECTALGDLQLQPGQQLEVTATF